MLNHQADNSKFLQFDIIFLKKNDSCFRGKRVAKIAAVLSAAVITRLRMSSSASIPFLQLNRRNGEDCGLKP